MLKNRSVSARWFRWGIFLCPILLAGVLYASTTLTLPLIYDTLLHIRIAKSLDWINVWLPTEKFGFYRPLTFAPFLAIRQLFGSYPAWLLHALNVGQHLLNVGLLVGLAWRLGWGRMRAMTAGILFALFPFSYQAIAVYGHNVHPTTTGLILLALHTYLWPSCRAQVATLLLFILALLSHESAILFGCFAILVTWQQSQKMHLPWRGIAYTLAGIVYAGIYQFLPISRAPQVVESSGTLWSKILYILQAGSYPFAWWAHRFPQLSAVTIVVLSVVATALLLWMSGKIRANRYALLLGVGWFGLAGTLIAIPLPATYLLHGPRLLYLSSVGLALGWSILIFPQTPTLKVSETFRILFLLYIAGTNWLFGQERLTLYQQLTSPVSTAQALTLPNDAQLLFVNLPQWVAPARNTYPMGAEFVAMLGDYLFAEELTHFNGLDYPTYAVVVPDLLANHGYSYGLHDQHQLADISWTSPTYVVTTNYLDTGITSQLAGILRPPTIITPPLATLGDYDVLVIEAIACGEKVKLDFTVRPQPNVSPTTTLFVQALGKQGLLGQADAPPLHLRPDLLTLPNHWELSETRTIPLATPQAVNTVLMGSYDFTTGLRHPSFDAQGNPLPDNALPVVVSTCAGSE